MTYIMEFGKMFEECSALSLLVVIRWPTVLFKIHSYNCLRSVVLLMSKIYLMIFYAMISKRISRSTARNNICNYYEHDEVPVSAMFTLDFTTMNVDRSSAMRSVFTIFSTTPF
jgi:hypothetical protein